MEPEGEKGVLLQTLRVCRAASWGRRFAGPCRRRLRPPQGGAARARLLAAAALGSSGEERRLPLGSPLPWGMAGDAGQLGALRRGQAFPQRSEDKA